MGCLVMEWEVSPGPSLVCVLAGWANYCLAVGSESQTVRILAYGIVAKVELKSHSSNHLLSL